MHGSAILNTLRNAAISGVPAVQAAIERLVVLSSAPLCRHKKRGQCFLTLYKLPSCAFVVGGGGFFFLGRTPCRMYCFRVLIPCRGVLLQQLNAWLLYGVLLDSEKEFFIQEDAQVEMYFKHIVF